MKVSTPRTDTNEICSGLQTATKHSALSVRWDGVEAITARMAGETLVASCRS